MSVRNTGLGKGLDSLIPIKDSSRGSDKSEEKKYTLEISRIKPNPHQPRRKFNEQELLDLSNSIKEHGVIQPLIVTKDGEDFILIAGERRLRASKLAGLAEVPVIFRETKESERLEIALIENIQRSDLNALEEAVAYKKLIDEFSMSQEEVAKRVGKARSTVANIMRLLSLPIEVKQGLREGKITEGHARAILALPTLEQQIALYNNIVSGNLNVRQAEAKIKSGGEAKFTSLSIELKNIIEQISGALNTKVNIQKKGKGGKILIEYYSDEELERIVRKIKN